MARRVLVTGAAGVVGEETVLELLRRPDRYEVVAFDLPLGHVRRRLKQFQGKADIVLGDLREPADVARALQGVDAVIHLAAMIPPRADHEPEEASSINLGGTRTLLEEIKQTGRQIRLLHMSSISVYGDRLKDFWIEVGDPIQPSPHDHYGETKVLGEQEVRKSGLPWTIFRLTGVMSHRIEMSPLMFHMPLETKFEIITSRDTGYAMVQALEKDGLEQKIFNLAGGPRCRATYREVLDRHLSIMGLGTGLIPDEAFAEGNFHCGFYRDSEELDALIGHHRDGLDEWFQAVKDRVNPLLPMLAGAFKPVARWYFTSRSEVLAARRSGQKDLLEHFCITDEDPSA